MSTCSGLETSIMPFAEPAWDFLEVAEAAAEKYLNGRWQISRVEFARDVIVSHSQELLMTYIRRAASLEIPGAAYFEEGKLGVTFIGVAGGDRLRIYHKGLETEHKFPRAKRSSALNDVVRVELQLRKGQLDDEIRKCIGALRVGRAKVEPREDDVPVMRLKPSRGHGIRRRHLRGMRRRRHPVRGLEASAAVDMFLKQHGFEGLLPGSGVTLPDPLYGKMPRDQRRR